MPGIYGFSVTKQNQVDLIDNMSKQMCLYEEFIQDKHFKTDKIAASRLHLGHIGEATSPIEKHGVFVWVEGETYNLNEIQNEFEFEVGESFATAIINTYQKGYLESFLNKIDGYFCASLYDSKTNQVKLISDRYGMRMLYWYFFKGQFAWASEVKGILALNCIDQTIDPLSFDCFMELGYLLGEHTWFSHIKLIKPATVLTYDLNRGDVYQEYYWKWSEIKPNNLSFNQAVDELGKRFIKAVERRFNPNEKIGIALSGGLDSRAIFAATNLINKDFNGYAYTFGVEECDDIQIAKQVIKNSNWIHEEFYFTDKNWFDSRIDKIWNTDGMLDMMHMHGSEFLDDISKKVSINLHGYSGDAILGGVFLNQIPLNERANKENIQSIFKQFSDLVSFNDDFYDINCVEPILQMNRVRRFTAMGTVNSLIKVDQRKPFFDNQLIELIFSLPDEYRVNNRLYSAMLHKFFPLYFNSIPWQKTGKPAGILKEPSLYKRIINKFYRVITSLFNIETNKDFTNYSLWVRSEKVAIKLKELLSRRNSIYKNLSNKDYYNDYLSPHLKNKALNKSSKILKIATIEIYLRRLKKQ